MHWPEGWRDAGALKLLEGTPIGGLIFSSTEGYASVMARAREVGITICSGERPPEGVEIVKGEWPGVRAAEGQADASGGPTGVPWIDSNGWLVRLVRARRPGHTVWVTADAPERNRVVPLARQSMAAADSAAHGGYWAVRLDRDMAAGLAAGKPELVAEWQQLMRVLLFFDSHREWHAWPVDAALAVVSRFAGSEEFMSREVLNLMARTDVSYSIVPCESLRAEALRGLRAVLYPDAQVPADGVRRTVRDFVAGGGLLIATPAWGKEADTAPASESHQRYEIRRLGKGRIALARKQPDDPYEIAQDAQVLVSHRYDRVHLFNGELLGNYCTVTPDGRGRLVHVMNYADVGEDPVTARVAGQFRSAKLWTPEAAEARRLEMIARGGGVEVRLPALALYGAIELEPQHV